MIKIQHFFNGFPFYNGKRVLVVQGDCECQLVRIKQSPTATKEVPFPPGDHEILTYQINAVDLYAGRKGRTVADLTTNLWLLDDVRRWIRGKHGYVIEALLRAEYRVSVNRER